MTAPVTRVRVAPDGRSFHWRCPECSHWTPNRYTACIKCARELTGEELVALAAASVDPSFDSSARWFRPRVSRHDDGSNFHWCCPQCDCWNTSARCQCDNCHRPVTEPEFVRFARAAAELPGEPWLTSREILVVVRWLIIPLVLILASLPLGALLILMLSGPGVLSLARRWRGRD